MSASPSYRPPAFLLCAAIVVQKINVKRRKAAIRVFVLIGTDSGRHPLDGHEADLGYLWLHTCLEILSSSGQ